MISQGRRPRAEASNMVGTVESVEPMESNNVAEMSIETGFDSLHEDILIKVFSYLGHADKLRSRLVNKHWCNVMNSWTGFKNSVVYTVKEKIDALETLNKSRFRFKTVRFVLDRLDESWFRTFCMLDAAAAANVISLKFKFSRDSYLGEYSWRSLKSIITMFSNLEELDIDKMYLTEVDKSSQEAHVTRDEELVHEKWDKLVKNLRSLRLFSFVSIEDMAKLLLHFEGLNNLRELKVSYIDALYYDLLKPDFEAVVDRLGHILSASRRSLKKLTIEASYLEPIVLDQIQLLSNLAELNLEFRCDPKHLQRCLQPLKKLEHVSLPSVYDRELGDGELYDIVTGLPRTVRSLALIQQCCFDPTFLDKFPALANLKSNSAIQPYVKTGKKYVNMRYLSCKISDTSTLDWITAFPNLTKLHIAAENENVTDLGLQTIIKNLKMLRCLEVERGNNITDYGVTGIKTEYLEFLYQTEPSSLYTDNSYEVPTQFRTGLPLCSLKGLNKLTIATCQEITNVGIRFGFGFKELRYLELNLEGPRPPLWLSPRMTDTRMALLRKMNPNLEGIHLDKRSSITISPSGVRDLLGQLERIKPGYTHRFSFEIQRLKSGIAFWKLAKRTGNNRLATH